MALLRSLLAVVLPALLGASLLASAHLQIHTYNARAAERLAQIAGER